jgi:ABC-type nickel/cobalt efflux system permease component RcnA
VGFPSFSARAHDIPNARVDRSIQATVSPGRLAIDYEVSLSELTLFQDLRMLIGVVPEGDRRDLFRNYGRETGPLNARGLLVTVDRRPVALRVLGYDLAVEEHPRYVFHYEAELAREGRLTIQDTNFAASEGTSRLAIRGRDGLSIRGDDLPPDLESIPARPVWQLSDAEERRTKQVAVDYEAPATVAVAPRLPPESGSRPPPRPSPTRPGTASSPRLGVERLSRLLERSAAPPALGLLLLAFGLGALHAIQPGHGKTLVAATVLGERGTWLRGVILALLTTLTHTGSVLLVAVGLWWTRSTRYVEIHLGLTHAAGFLIGAIGLWRLGRHLADYGEHDVAEEDAQGSPASHSNRGLVGLGVAGGLVPCWDAVVLIVLAEATGRLALGIALLLAFGMGMALVLVAVGVLSARIRRRLVGRAGVGSYGPRERRLGMAGGLTLAAIGIYLMGFT